MDELRELRRRVVAVGRGLGDAGTISPLRGLLRTFLALPEMDDPARIERTTDLLSEFMRAAPQARRFAAEFAEISPESGDESGASFTRRLGLALRALRTRYESAQTLSALRRLDHKVERAAREIDTSLHEASDAIERRQALVVEPGPKLFAALKDLREENLLPVTSALVRRRLREIERAGDASHREEEALEEDGPRPSTEFRAIRREVDAAQRSWRVVVRHGGELAGWLDAASDLLAAFDRTLLVRAEIGAERVAQELGRYSAADRIAGLARAEALFLDQEWLGLGDELGQAIRTALEGGELLAEGGPG